MALANLNYDLHETCFQSVDEEEKLNYWSNKLNPWAQYAQVSLRAIIQQVMSWNVLCEGDEG